MLLTLFALVAVPFSLLSGLFEWAPSSEGLLALALLAVVLPALGEELIFRAPLLWFQKRGAVFWPAALSLILFVLWHPFNAWLFLQEARTLATDPRFLFLVVGLGLACTFATLRSGSLWPAVLIHWLVVVSWKGLFGGPQFLKLV